MDPGGDRSGPPIDRLIDELQVLAFVRDGWIIGPAGALYGSAAIVVNCPIVARFL